MCNGGESGIRTHGTVSRTHAFQACALSHSAISPRGPLLKAQPRFGKRPPRNARAFPQAPENIPEFMKRAPKNEDRVNRIATVNHAISSPAEGSMTICRALIFTARRPSPNRYRALTDRSGQGDDGSAAICAVSFLSAWACCNVSR
jgi:hypothetical protein